MPFRTNTITTALRFAAFTMILALPVPVQAASYQVVVHYADLRISDTAGARALLMRLRSAARQVCAGALEKTYQACLQASQSRAVAAVDAPLVSSLYREWGTAAH